MAETGVTTDTQSSTTIGLEEAAKNQTLAEGDAIEIIKTPNGGDPVVVARIECPAGKERPLRFEVVGNEIDAS